MPDPTTPRPVRWNVCPDCGDRHEDGAACHPELQETAEAEPTGDLRERLTTTLDEALRTVGLARNLSAYRDALLPVVEAETAALWDQIHRDQHDAMAATQRAEEAEDRLRKAGNAYALLSDRAEDAEEARERWRQRAEKAEAAEQRVRKLATDAQQAAERSSSRMFGGHPFRAMVPAADLLAALDQPEETPDA